MKEPFKHHKNMRFIRTVTSHKNGTPESSIKKVVTIDRYMFMNAALICPKDTFYTDTWPM